MSARSRQAGIALVLVLWVIALLTVIAGSFTLGVRREATVARFQVDATQARAAAEAGIRIAMLGLLDNDPDRRWHADGRAYQLSFGDAALEISVSAETGRIDLNAADPILIEGALRVAGVSDEGEQTALRDAIVDWRGGSGRGSKPFANPDEDRTGPFLATEDLLKVPGVSPRLFARLAPLVTVHSRQPGIDPTVASASVLMALPGATEQIVDTYLTQRKNALDLLQPVPDFPIPGFRARSSRVYGVRSRAELPSGSAQVVRAVIVQQGAPGREPFSIVHFRLGLGS